jgi:hypothetical protein
VVAKQHEENPVGMPKGGACVLVDHLILLAVERKLGVFGEQGRDAIMFYVSEAGNTQ